MRAKTRRQASEFTQVIFNYLRSEGAGGILSAGSSEVTVAVRNSFLSGEGRTNLLPRDIGQYVEILGCHDWVWGIGTSISG